MNTAGRLASWKEIASYLGVSVRTAQRWERTEGLPARRHRHEVLSSVFAYPEELEQWWHSRPDLQSEHRQAPPPARTLAVLPFTNLNRDEENEILSDGLTEELINTLARVEGLHVVARGSAFHFKGISVDVREAGAKLGVQTLLEGSLRRSGDRLRVTAQLVSASDGYHLWSRRFDRRLTDLFDLQEELAQALARALEVELAPASLTRQNSQDLAAYELYLEGRFQCNRRTRAGFLRGVECFEQALAKDPRMARAWAGLADCHAFLGPLAGVPAEESLPRARAAALKALALEPTLPEAHCALGFVAAVLEFDWPSAGHHFRLALKHSPDHANSHIWYGGHVLAATGLLEEAAAHADRACELDPLSPPALSGRGGSRVMLRRPAEAEEACRRTLALHPGYPFALRFLGESFLLRGMHEEAARAFSQIDAPVIAEGFLGFCFTRLGEIHAARGILARLERMSQPSPALQIAAVQLGLGDRDAALVSLRRASDDKSMGVHWLKVEPFWDPLRDDARFQDVLRGMRLTG
jgi:serine/threonine-protein kinase